MPLSSLYPAPNAGKMRRPFLLLLAIFAINTLFAQPVITSFSPGSGPIGTTVTILGNNFNTSTAGNQVWFGAVKASVSAASATALTVTVPAGASYRPITVTTGSLTSYSSSRFVVTFSGADTILHANSFGANQDYAAGTTPTNLTHIDLNGDGRSDIIAANYSGSSFSVYRNSSSGGTISFQPQEVVAVSGRVVSVDAGDLDGDGRPDIVVADELNNVSIYLNTTTSDSVTFSPEIVLTTASYAQGIAIGDLDGDGKPDIAVTNNQSTSVSVFRNTGTPGALSFDSPLLFTTGSAPQCVVIGDLDGDGKAELVVSNYYGASVSVFKNTGTPGTISFAGKADFTCGTQPYVVAIGDLDGDGRPDLATGNSIASTVSVLRNTSAGGTFSFDTHIDYPTGITPYGIAIADLDGDGIPDIAESNYSVSPSKVSVLKNKSTPGAIGFYPKIDFSTGNAPYSTSIGDFDGDGRPDLATANFGGSSVSVLQNHIGSPGTAPGAILPFIAAFTPAYGPAGTTVTITGSNFDTTAANNIVWFGAAKAAVVSGNAHTLTVTVPAGATYKPITITAHHLSTASATAFHLTFAGGGAAFGPASFNLTADSLTSNNPRQVTGIDLDGDGRTDLLVSNQGETTVSAYRNTGTGQTIAFAAGLSLTVGDGPFNIATGDLDGDGKPDVAVTRFNAGNASSVIVFRNTSTPGNLSFAAGIDLPTGNGSAGVAIGDLDGDGKPDLAVCSGNSGYVSLFMNTSPSTGVISFAPRWDLYEYNHVDHLAIGDLDHDGIPDLAFVYFGTRAIAIRRNTSTPGVFSFDPDVDYTVGSDPIDIAIADLDGDGLPDIAVPSYSAKTFSVLRNTNTAPGSIQFELRQEYAIGGSPLSISIGDLDGDGRPDIVMPIDSPAVFSIIKNTSTDSAITFAARVDYPTGFSPTYAGIADLDNDGMPDLAVGNHYEKVSIARNTTGEPTVAASGASPVQGPVTRTFYLDSTVQTYNGSVYVQRHYDITAASNAANATATITLYFSQPDFDHFNAVPGHGPSLPTGPTDTAGIANLRIFQYHGTSTTHLPGSYSGLSLTIDPQDAAIKWNNSTKWWEVSFDITGFSGFFAGNKGSSLVTAVDDIIYPGGNGPLHLYPNPAWLWVTVVHPSTSHAAQLRLVDIAGRTMKTVNLEKNASKTEIYLRGLAPGIYNMIWQSGTKTFTRALMIKRSQ